MAYHVEASSLEMETIKKELFNTAMKGDWEEVIRIYEKDDRAHHAKITRSADTALHVAVSDCQEDVVKKLVRQIVEKQSRPESVLNIGNDRGNTALHFAAAMGNVRMCKWIAEVEPSLVGSRNKDRETPLFLAALRGKKEAFLCLHAICGPELGASYCRRDDGQTALHCAIAGEYFDLAFQIIHQHEQLVNSVDEHGLSPLHILASKPFAFKSGSNLGPWHKIIYHCTFVDELKPESPSLFKGVEDENKSNNFPDNYKTCFNVFQLLRNAVQVVSTVRDDVKGGSKRADAENPQGPKVALSKQHNGQPLTRGAQGHHLFPSNYTSCFNFVKVICKALLVILGFGSRMITKVKEKKEKHIWSVQMMNELLKNASMFEYENTGAGPQAAPSHKEDAETKPYEIINDGDATFACETFDQSFPFPVPSTDLAKTSQQNNEKGMNGEEKGTKSCEIEKKETAILIAAKNGVTEMVEKILELFPVAIHDVNSEKKNIVLLAVEHRQPHVYRLLLKRSILKDSVFQQVDDKGNSALHLAAMLGDYKPWLIPGAALQMQWEIKWYEFVKRSMPPNFFVRYNNDRKTAKDIFTETHTDLVKAGGEWLTNTSESCSVVAALIATVAFATSTTVPGGNDSESGKPTLEDKPAFEVFAISSLVALSFSVTSVVMFLAILTSRYQEKDFGKDLPRKLLVGLTSLFVSIAAILLSFCAGHFFVLQDKLQYAAFPVYAVTCLPVSFFALAQFPLYFDLIWANFKKVPQRSFKIAVSPT